VIHVARDGKKIGNEHRLCADQDQAAAGDPTRLIEKAPAMLSDTTSLALAAGRQWFRPFDPEAAARAMCTSMFVRADTADAFCPSQRSRAQGKQERR
jgi:hypothetical protein